MQVLEFDYLVVGGGAAGCVLAARLAKDSDARVCLVERGRSDTNPWIHIPATFFKALQSQDSEAVISEHDQSLGRPFAVPQGKVLGGGSSVNGMIYMRGQAQDYDDWAFAHGCSGWAYEDVLPVFKRQEANQNLEDAYHGTSGALKVSNPANPHPLHGLAIEAAVAAGIPRTQDFNGAVQEGVGWYQVTAHKGKRQSAAQCFLKPELGRENLSLLTGLSAQRLRFEGKRVTALEAKDQDGQEFLIKAAREIILTAGSFQSPKLLMLSGIGPSDELARHGIEVLHHAPEVGANLQDHLGTPVTAELNRPMGFHGQDKGLAAVKNGFDYWVRGKGLLTSNLLDAGACVDTSGAGRPDVQYNISGFAPGAPGQPPLACHAIQIHPMTMRPASISYLGLKSTDPADAPKVNSSVLDQEADMDTLRRGIRVAQDILAQEPLKSLISDPIWPEPGVSTRVGSNSLDEAIRKQARTIYHPSGTCRMGRDRHAVVDTELRVQGVEGLRVADCSIMPALVSGNTNAPTMMIADRCADFILADAF